VFADQKNRLISTKFAVRLRMDVRRLAANAFDNVTGKGFKKRKKSAENGRDGTTLARVRKSSRPAGSAGKKRTSSNEPRTSWSTMPFAMENLKSQTTAPFVGKPTYLYMDIMTTTQNPLMSDGFVRIVTRNGTKNTEKV